MQFYPKNVEYSVRKKLHKLQHGEDIQKHIWEFSALMLDIKNMNEDDKLFYILE